MQPTRQGGSAASSSSGQGTIERDIDIAGESLKEALNEIKFEDASTIQSIDTAARKIIVASPKTRSVVK